MIGKEKADRLKRFDRSPYDSNGGVEHPVQLTFKKKISEDFYKKRKKAQVKLRKKRPL